MTGFLTRSLQFVSLIGFAFNFFGLLLYVLIAWFAYGSAVPGFTFFASLVFLFSGAHLLALGIIGEYLARMHFMTMNRPPYLVREVLAGPPNEP